jgi:hypothetical protein
VLKPALPSVSLYCSLLSMSVMPSFDLFLRISGFEADARFSADRRAHWTAIQNLRNRTIEEENHRLQKRLLGTQPYVVQRSAKARRQAAAVAGVKGSPQGQPRSALAGAYKIAPGVLSGDGPQRRPSRPSSSYDSSYTPFTASRPTSAVGGWSRGQSAQRSSRPTSAMNMQPSRPQPAMMQQPQPQSHYAYAQYEQKYAEDEDFDLTQLAHAHMNPTRPPSGHQQPRPAASNHRTTRPSRPESAAPKTEDLAAKYYVPPIPPFRSHQNDAQQQQNFLGLPTQQYASSNHHSASGSPQATDLGEYDSSTAGDTAVEQITHIRPRTAAQYQPALAMEWLEDGARRYSSRNAEFIMHVSKQQQRQQWAIEQAQQHRLAVAQHAANYNSHMRYQQRDPYAPDEKQQPPYVAAHKNLHAQRIGRPSTAHRVVLHDREIPPSSTNHLAFSDDALSMLMRGDGSYSGHHQSHGVSSPSVVHPASMLEWDEAEELRASRTESREDGEAQEGEEQQQTRQIQFHERSQRQLQQEAEAEADEDADTSNSYEPPAPIPTLPHSRTALHSRLR